MPTPQKRPLTIMFACLHNAGRSQMAAAFFQRFADPRVARSLSAGTQPADRVHPEVVEAMREAGFDLRGARPRLLTTELASGADWLVTMGCGESCPVVPGTRHEDWPVEDPKDRSLDEVRRVRDQLEQRVLRLVRAEGWARSGAPG